MWQEKFYTFQREGFDFQSRKKSNPNTHCWTGTLSNTLTGLLIHRGYS